jgi:Uma2 family endonuclease
MVIKVGPADHGRRMSLTEFYHAEVKEGYRYELGRGVVIVSEIPNYRHLLQVDGIRQLLLAHWISRAEHSHLVASAGECKIPVACFESERHPDLAVYRTPPSDEEDPWFTWIPEIVIEIVSPESEHRDYVEKREEYLAFAVREYWIVDADKEEVLVLKRIREHWRERVLRPHETYQTRLLPGFTLDCGAIFRAAQAAGG